MANTLKIGIVYHVVDKTTGEVVKVGSTIQLLSQRFNAAYKKKHSNHFLREARTIKSSELDWYQKGDYDCPFLWHLAAIEHLEMLKMGTYRKGPLSNKQSPLDQKSKGFDAGVAGTIGGQIGGLIGGKISGRIAAESGRLASYRTPEHQKKAGIAAGAASKERQSGFLSPDYPVEKIQETSRKNGRANVESGHIYTIATLESCSKGGLTQGRRNAESGHMSKIGKSIPPEVRSAISKKSGPLGMHIRWHVNRGIVSSTCIHCKK